MDTAMKAMHAIGRALLPVAVGLLFEELTLGGLVRLILAPWPRTAKNRERKHTGEGK
jgi:hypothetical protein